MDSKSIASVLLRRLVSKQEMVFFPLRTGISPFFDPPRTGRLFYLGSCLFLWYLELSGFKYKDMHKESFPLQPCVISWFQAISCVTCLRPDLGHRTWHRVDARSFSLCIMLRLILCVQNSSVTACMLIQFATCNDTRHCLVLVKSACSCHYTMAKVTSVSWRVILRLRRSYLITGALISSYMPQITLIRSP